LRNDLRLELKRIQQDTGATMLYVTHDQVEALTLANRIGVLDHGRLVQLGTPQQVYQDPDTVAVASRLGSPRINLIARSALAQLHMPDGVKTVGVRAEHIHIHAADANVANSVPAAVVRLERLSDQYLVHVRLQGSGQELIVSCGPEQLAQAGQDVHLQLTQCLWFDAADQRVRK
jgi:multiple sugar transport system ATP-binding protein